MKKVIITILIFLSLVALILRFGFNPLIKFLGISPRSGIRVESTQKAQVFVNNQPSGVTPFENQNLAPGEYLVSLQPLKEATSTSPFAPWQGYVKLNAGTLSIVNRELAETQAASSGEIITLEKGKGVTLISTPPEAQVSIDGKEAGRTPISVSDLKVGEHQFIIGKENYLKRSIKATVVDNYNLTINVDLSLSAVDLTKIPTVPVSEVKQVVIKQTPTGFLRVRKTASTNGEEVGRVSPGDTLPLIDDSSLGWYKIKLSDNTEGFISSTYAEKKTQ